MGATIDASPNANGANGASGASLAANACVAPSTETSAVAGSAESWSELFAQVEELEKLGSGSRRSRELADHLSTLASERDGSARKQKDAIELFHARVLRASVQRISSGPIAWRVLEPGVPFEWIPREPWLAAQVLVPGNLRADALGRAIGAVNRETSAARLSFAAHAADEDAAAFQLESAERIARTLHEQSPSPESAVRLALDLTARGAAVEAEALLGSALTQAESSRPRSGADNDDVNSVVALHLARAHARFAAGSRVAALHDLGAAFARESRTAGLLLARCALADGNAERGRAVAGSILAADPRSVEARRLWGLSLVLARPEPAAASAAASDSSRSSNPWPGQRPNDLPNAPRTACGTLRWPGKPGP